MAPLTSGAKNSHCPVHWTLLSSIHGLCSLDASSGPSPRVTTTRASRRQRCPLGQRHPPAENHSSSCNTFQWKSVWAVCVGPVTERVIYRGPLKPSVLGFPDGPSGSDSCFRCRGHRFESLVGELKSRMSWGAAENKALFSSFTNCPCRCSV